MQTSHYYQVLTGVLPYEGSKKVDMIKNIRHGKRPPRPRDPNQNQWLEGPVWDVIATCWKNELGYRYELSVVYEVFSMPSRQDTQSVKSDKSGNLHLRKRTNLTIAERSQTSKQGYSNVYIFFHGSPLSSSFYELQSQRLRSLSMTWTR
jgi:hypothetical protein